MAKTPIVPSTTTITFEKRKAKQNATTVPIKPKIRLSCCTYKIAGKIKAPKTA